MGAGGWVLGSGCWVLGGGGWVHAGESRTRWAVLIVQDIFPMYERWLHKCQYLLKFRNCLARSEQLKVCK